MSTLSELLGGGGGGQVLEFTASGSLTDGELVGLGSDGTVSSFVSAAQSAGTGVAYNATDARYSQVAFDPVNERIVISYEDDDFSGYGAAIVSATIPGTSISSYGTKVIYYSGVVEKQSISYDSANAKMVIFYKDLTSGGAPGKAIVGTVSGSSITFGTSVTFDASNPEIPNSLYVPSLGKIILAYSLGAVGYAIVGTVSGTSISFGSRVDSGLSHNNYNYGLAYDPGLGKLVMASREDSTGYTEVVVGTVSGTSISFGSVTVINSVSGGQHTYVVYHEAENCFVSSFNNSGSTGVKAFTISGTAVDTLGAYQATSVARAFVYTPEAESISLFRNSGITAYVYTITVSDLVCSVSSTFTFTLLRTPTDEISTSVMPTGRVALGYNDTTSYGAGQIYQAAYDTYSSFIGISDAAYADGVTATVQVVGAVDDAQSGLTAGNKYYVSSSGGLTQSATSGIYVGAAISSTEILIKG